MANQRITPSVEISERDLTITKLEVESGVDLAKAGIGAEVAARRAGAAGGGGNSATVQSPDPGGA